MKYAIHTEGFELTDAIRDHWLACMRDIQNALPDKLSADAFCKQDGPKSFTCTVTAHLWRRDWVVKRSGPDLYTLISDTHKSLERLLHKAKEKRKALLHKRAAHVRERPWEEVRA
ncbi:MAG TPA: HPF/RaiA family ribosome-associated protein [Bdellovibrionales bacterium]|nr:HPF/RaiA family ribosome-associated protein [Bdellovibrionales bacterium]